MADARRLLGKPVARNINETTLEKSQAFIAKHNRPLRLAVLVSADPSGQSYLKTIRSTARKVEADVQVIPVDTGWDISRIRQSIERLNEDPDVDGILVQEPLPDGIALERIGRMIDPLKDVDGITPHQSGLLFRDSKKALAPPTARAVIEILDFYRYGLEGLEVVVLGRSLVVGKPVGILTLRRHATMTWCHSRTQALPTICKRAEILIVAIGRMKMIDSRYVRPGATVIDVGINVDDNGKLAGDVDTKSIQSIASAFTPVPGGIGPITTACLFDNLQKAVAIRISKP